MHPYENYRLIEAPDLVDIRTEGRKSSVGRVIFINGKASQSWKKRNKLVYRAYSKPASKKATRRHMKRADKAKALKQALQD